MATDRRADHVGNHGGAYTDIDGMSKQFTIIDHDKKTTISSGTLDKVDKDWSTKYRALLIKRIAEISPSICPEPFQDYTVRGEGKATITWNTDMLIDKGVPLNQLRDLCVLLENKAAMVRLTF